jgi:hypothetical protein
LKFENNITDSGNFSTVWTQHGTLNYVVGAANVREGNYSMNFTSVGYVTGNPTNLNLGTSVGTVQFWVNLMNLTGAWAFTDTGDYTTNNIGLGIQAGGGGSSCGRAASDLMELGGFTSGDACLPLYNWTMLTYSWSGGLGKLYKNGVLLNSSFAVSGLLGNNWMLGAETAHSPNQYANMLLDDFRVFVGRQLTDQEVLDAYNNGSGNGNSYPFTTISFVSPTPVDGANNNTNVTFNVSCTKGGYIYLWLDQSTNPTNLVINAVQGNAAYTTGVNVSGSYYYIAGCFQAGIGWVANTTVRSWDYDVTNPMASLLAGNAFTVGGLSNVNQYTNDSVPINISLSDNNQLYLYELDAYLADTGAQVYTNSSLVTGVQYNLSLVMNTSTWPSNERYNLTLWVSDSHTSDVIGDYTVSEVVKNPESLNKGKLIQEGSGVYDLASDDSLDGLLFNTAEGNEVLVQSVDDATLSTNRLADRYSFDVTYADELVADRTFIVRSDRPITYLPDSPYPGHFVIWNQDTMSGNWLDFEGVGGYPTVVKDDEYTYEVSFVNLPAVALFESIGGLNVVQYNYS